MTPTPTTTTPMTTTTSTSTAEMYPPDLSLEQVQVLFRHGERTPSSARFVNAGLAPVWPDCKSIDRFIGTVAASTAASSSSSGGTPAWTDVTVSRVLEAMGPYGAPIPVLGPGGERSGLCDYGELTDTGRRSTLALGHRLRQRYVTDLGFLPSTLSDPSILYLRSTSVPRTIHSTQQVFSGLYPASFRSPTLGPVQLVTRTQAEETHYPNESVCPRLGLMIRAFCKRAATKWNDSPEMEYLTARLGKWMPSGKVAVDSRPRSIGILDTVFATRAHDVPGVKLPDEFSDPKVVDILHKVGVDEWFSGVRESTEFRTLAVGPLGIDVMARMMCAVGPDGSNPDAGFTPSAHPFPQFPLPMASTTKIALVGCHDTTLAGFLTALGAFENQKWPPFTSTVAIELFRQKSASANSIWSSSWGALSAQDLAGIREPHLPPPARKLLDSHFVRVMYNDQPVVIPACRPEGKHKEGDETMCTLTAFKAAVDSFRPTDWRRQCKMNLDKDPLGVEPAKPTA